MSADPLRPRPARRRSCPICGKPASDASYPFCSKRCADIDLNRWLSSAYSVPGSEDAGDGEEAETQEK